MTIFPASSYPLADETIKNHVLYAMGAGLVPIPLIDIAAVTAIQLDMLKQLSRQFGVDYSETSGKAFAAALTGTTAARLGASAIKMLPGIGWALGGVSMSLLSGASTYALGQVFLDHFSKGGTMSNFDVEENKASFARHFEQGKQKAADWKNKESAAAASYPPNLVEDLKALAELKQNGILTDEEFERLKARKLAQLG